MLSDDSSMDGKNDRLPVIIDVDVDVDTVEEVDTKITAHAAENAQPELPSTVRTAFIQPIVLLCTISAYYSPEVDATQS